MYTWHTDTLRIQTLSKNEKVRLAFQVMANDTPAPLQKKVRHRIHIGYIDILNHI